MPCRKGKLWEEENVALVLIDWDVKKLTTMQYKIMIVLSHEAGTIIMPSLYMVLWLYEHCIFEWFMDSMLHEHWWDRGLGAYCTPPPHKKNGEDTRPRKGKEKVERWRGIKEEKGQIKKERKKERKKKKEPFLKLCLFFNDSIGS